MDKDLVGGNLGSVGKYDVAFKDGFLVAECDANVAYGSAGVVLKVSAFAVVEAIKKAIPGQIDDAVLSLLERALGIVPPPAA